MTYKKNPRRVLLLLFILWENRGQLYTAQEISSSNAEFPRMVNAAGPSILIPHPQELLHHTNKCLLYELLSLQYFFWPSSRQRPLCISFQVPHCCSHLHKTDLKKLAIGAVSNFTSAYNLSYILKSRLSQTSGKISLFSVISNLHHAKSSLQFSGPVCDRTQ